MPAGAASSSGAALMLQPLLARDTTGWTLSGAKHCPWETCLERQLSQEQLAVQGCTLMHQQHRAICPVCLLFCICLAPSWAALPSGIHDTRARPTVQAAPPPFASAFPSEGPGDHVLNLLSVPWCDSATCPHFPHHVCGSCREWLLPHFVWWYAGEPWQRGRDG